MIHVTEVLDSLTEKELLGWMLREGKATCEKISQEALRVGTLVDLLVQADVKGTPPPVYLPTDTPVVNSLQAWQRFKEDHPMFLSTVTGIQTELTDGEVVGHPDLEITEPSTRQFSDVPLSDHIEMRTGGITTYTPGRWGIVDIKTSKAIMPKHWTQVAKYADLTGRPILSSTPPAFIAILRLDKLTGLYEYKEITDLSTIHYEIGVFDAYLTAYQHGQRIREVMRQLAETETLDVA